MTPFHRTRIAQGGMSLVELMIAVSIGLFLTAVVSQIFLSTKTSFKYQENMSRIQENARFAMEAIAKDIRNAGFNGCGSVTKVANVVNNSTTDWWLDFSNAVRGYEGGVDTFPSPFNATAIANTDAIILIGVDSSNEVGITNHNPVSAQIDTASNGFSKGQILVITDCKQTSIFQMTGPTSSPPNTNIVHNTGVAGVSPGNCNKELGASCPTATAYTFSAGAAVSRLSSKAYYIAQGSVPDQRGVYTNSLWVASLGGSTTGSTTAIELVPNMQNMQIEYGVDSDGDSAANVYQKANTISGANNWSKVVSVRLQLLLVSPEDNLSSTKQTYTFDGTATTATDNRIRRPFTTTINMRNRTL